MWICICNSLSDRAIATALSDGAGTTAEVYQRAGCRPQCGKCIPTVSTMVRSHHGAGHADVLPTPERRRRIDHAGARG